ncbi:tubulin-folding cofactor B-like isoform X2 [Oratosquilla oratoria]|uniref:tubulin-folding cofactor B-like isoform X2 n=1 Tax=Oratosquilla oratoria TaxID=337810 RepID=UPI003F76A27F
MADVIQVISAPMVNVRVTSSLTNFTSERRFDKSLTIGDFKNRLELVTGASAGSMQLEILDEKDKPVCPITDNSALLGSLPIEDNYRIHVTDSCQKQGAYDDLSKVDKFELSADEYNKRDDSVRSFLLRNKLGKYNQEEQARLTEQKEAEKKAESDKAASLVVGERCEVRVQGEPTRRGVVMFIGKTHFSQGIWVGVKYDEPLGKNDGSVGGKRYFEAPNKYGGFTRPSNVEMGDFPEISYDEEDEM